MDENNNKIFEKPTPSKDNVFKNKEPVVEEKFEAKKAQPSSVYKDNDNDDKSPNYKILDDLKSVTKHVGDSATLQCKVSPGTVNVQWLKDNELLSGSNYRTYKKNDTYFLELNDLTPDNSGIYTFVASDLKKSVASSSTLNVLTG